MDERKDPFAKLGLGRKPEVPSVLQNRPSEATRNRGWEKRNPTRGYRGIPQELHDWFKEQADREGIDLGELVRFAMDDFRSRVEDGTIDLRQMKTPIIGKNTLYG